ncbi:hypothetical protein BASA81_002671 [Batrachochytrium salamandrivorans]|nr:hypothetical protein BASA81_002671 [Batrachochytrium salamandrivorans]
MSLKCTRTMACRCDECTAAMGMFSARDLIAVSSSKVDFEEGENPPSASAPAKEQAPVAVVAAPPVTQPLEPKALKPWQKPKRPAEHVDVCLTPTQPPAPSTGGMEDAPKPRPRTGPRFTKPPTPTLIVPGSGEEDEIQIFSKPPQPFPPPQPLPPPPAAASTAAAEEDMEEEERVIAKAQSPTRQTARQEVDDEDGVGKSTVVVEQFVPLSFTAAVGTDESEVEEDFSAMSLEERISSSKWKARQSAYLEITQTHTHQDLLDKAVETEINPANLDLLLEAMIACCETSQEDRPGKWIPSLAKRCFTGRPSVAQRSIDLVMELFACDPPEQVGNALLHELASKNAKVVVASLKCIRVACAYFGPGKVVPVPCILKAVELGMSAIPPATRTEAFALAVEAIAWLGDDFVQLLNAKLTSDTQRRELERKIAEEKRATANNPMEKRKPTRFRRQGNGQAATAAEDAANGSGMGEDRGGDMFDFLPAADILTKLDRAPTEFEKRINHHEWKTRKAVLEEVELQCGKPPKLVSTMDYSPLVNVLKKTIAGDANHAVLVQALSLLLALSEGLRTSFAFLARISLVVLLEKYRDQKLAQAVDQVVDSYCRWSFQIGDERSCAQIGETLQHPKCTPVQLLNTIKWIERAVLQFGKQRSNVDFEPLRQLVRQHAMTHRNPNVRQAANSALNALKDGAVGVTPLPTQQQPQAKPLAKVAPSIATKPTTTVSVPAAATTRHSTTTIAARTIPATTTAPFSRAPELVTIDKLAKFSPAFAQALQSAKSPEPVLKTLFDAVQDFEGELTHAELEEVFRFVGSKTKEWSDPQWFAPLASDVLLALLDRAPNANLADYVLTVVLNNAVGFQQADLLTEIAIVAGPQVVVHRVSRTLKANGQGNLKAKLFALEYCAACLKAFDLVSFSELDDFCACIAGEHVGSNEESVKTACTQVWFELFRQLGSDHEFQQLVAPVLPPPLILEVVRRAHIAARSGGVRPAATETWRFPPQDPQVASSFSPSVQDSGQYQVIEEADTLQQIDRLLPSLNNSDVAQWKKREDALEHLEHLLRLLPPLPATSKIIQSLASVLCKRLDDAQRNLAARAATCLGLLCTCVSANGSALLLKQCMATSLLHSLSDRKPQIFQACQTALTLSVMHHGIISLPCLVQVLQVGLDLLHRNKIDKVKLLTWLLERLGEMEDQQTNLAQPDGMLEDNIDLMRNVFLDFIPVLLGGFMAKELPAKRASIRIAEIVVSFLPEQLAQAKFRSASRDLKFADQRLVDPIVEEVMRKALQASRSRREVGGGSSRMMDSHPSAVSSRMRSPSPVSVARVLPSSRPVSPQQPPLQNRGRPTTPPLFSPHRPSPSSFTEDALSSSSFVSSTSSSFRPSYPSPARMQVARPSTPPPRMNLDLHADSARSAMSAASSSSLALYLPPSHTKFERQLQLMITNITDFENALLTRGENDPPFPQSRDMLLMTRLETSVDFMRKYLAASPSPNEISEPEWERLVEDMFSAHAVLNSFDMSLKHLVGGGIAREPVAWRVGAWQGRVAKLCLAGAVALASKRSIRVSLETESFTLTLIQLHALASRDAALEQAIEATFRSIRETNSWLPTVLSLRDKPGNFVQREVIEFCEQQRVADEPFYFVNLEECYDLVSRDDDDGGSNHWVAPEVTALFRQLLNGSEPSSNGNVTAVGEQEDDAGLREIFQRIIAALENNQTDECRRGVEELRKFKAQNVELFAMLDPASYIEHTAPLFQEYIMDKLREPLFFPSPPPGFPHEQQLQQPQQPAPPTAPSSEIKRRLEQMRHRSQMRMLTLPVMPMPSLD